MVKSIWTSKWIWILWGTCLIETITSEESCLTFFLKKQFKFKNVGDLSEQKKYELSILFLKLGWKKKLSRISDIVIRSMTVRNSFGNSCGSNGNGTATKKRNHAGGWIQNPVKPIKLLVWKFLDFSLQLLKKN